MYSTSCFQFICVFLSFPPVCACVRACPRAFHSCALLVSVRKQCAAPDPCSCFRSL